MSHQWITPQQADALLTLCQDMAELITCVADDIDEGFRDKPGIDPRRASEPERALLARFDALWADIEQKIHQEQPYEPV